MGEFSVERLASDLAVEKYLAPQPRQGVVGTLYVLALVAGVLLAVALTVLFVQIALQESAPVPGSRADAAAGPVTGAAADGAEGAGSDAEPGVGGYRLKDFYLECALDGSRRRPAAGDMVACGRIADVLLA